MLRSLTAGTAGNCHTESIDSVAGNDTAAVYSSASAFITAGTPVRLPSADTTGRACGGPFGTCPIGVASGHAVMRVMSHAIASAREVK
jgi:hypothetical protein